MDILFDILSKAGFDDVSAALFHILHGNMSEIAPTGESYESDKQMWVSSIKDALENPKRNIIIIKNEAEIIGFFMFSINKDLLKMEEIQFKKEHQGTGLFNSLFRYVFKLIPDDVKHVEAFANKLNIRSQSILTHLKLQPAGENKNGRCFRYCGLYRDMQGVIECK